MCSISVGISVRGNKKIPRHQQVSTRRTTRHQDVVRVIGEASLRAYNKQTIVYHPKSPRDRRHRAASKGERKLRHDAPAKNEPNKNRQQTPGGHIRVQKRLEQCINLKGCLAPALARPPASMILVHGDAGGTKSVPIWLRVQRVRWHRTTNNRHRKDVLEMGSLRGYVEPQSATAEIEKS